MNIDLNITLSSDVVRSPRVQQLEGLFDVAPAERSVRTWRHHFVLPEHWRIGVIVGPSGAGKSTLAQRAFGDALAAEFGWPSDRSILDAFPADMGIMEITGLLSSVGFSSPPAWLRPFTQLSTGEQFRVNVARALAENKNLCVIDEFTSVVDRVAARIGSAAAASAVRRKGGKFVAVTCHYDVIDWLDPDWIYEPHTQKLTLRQSDAICAQDTTQDRAMGSHSLASDSPLLAGALHSLAIAAPSAAGVCDSLLDGSHAAAPAARGRLRRPAIDIDIRRCGTKSWALFKPHHYLSGALHPGAKCFLASVWGRPAAFVAVLPFPHPTAPGWREHRCVCLPDFQGVGLGNACSEFVASLFAACSKKYLSISSHPAMIAHRKRSPLWRMTRATSLSKGGASRRMQKMRKTQSTCRLTASFVYKGPTRPEEARRLGLKPLQRQPMMLPAAIAMTLAPQTAMAPAMAAAP